MSRSVGASTIDATLWRGRAIARSSLKVATSRAGGIGAPVHGPGVVASEGADEANGRGGGAPGGDMALSPAVLALRIPVGRVGAFNSLRSREETNRGAHREQVPWMDGDNNGGGSLALPGLWVGVEVSGAEDAYILGGENRLRKAREELLWVLWEEGKWEGVDGELCFIEGEAEGQPGRLTHGKQLVELAGEGVDIWRKGPRGGGSVGDEKGDRSTVIDLGGDCEGEDAIRISQDSGSNVWEGGSN